MRPASLYIAGLILAGFLCACQAAESPNLTAPKASTCLSELPIAVQVPSGTSLIGNDRAYPEEAPQRKITFEEFNIDSTEVTNGQFRAFVKDTSYVTDAEKTQAGFNVPGGAVFTAPSPSNPSWWQFMEGASWRHPEGPESTIIDRDFDPVVQVSLADAKAYAAWKDRRLPSDAEWEYAARGGSDSHYVWGIELNPDGKQKANTWQGVFPVTNSDADGYARRAPVGCFDKNAYGIYDMIGNVWEWTDTPYSGPLATTQYIIKGGSFLCAENYCRRYRASALQPQDADLTTNHIGFRTVSK